MNILDIRMNHFGKFTNQNMQFHSGVNIIYGENETGKSTMHAFIRAMLFGLERGRGKASRKDEYTLCTPWENSGYFAGSMRFEVEEKVYVIYRNFSKQEKEVRLYCETDGIEYEDVQEKLNILLSGMDENTFCNTLFVGRQTGETDEGLAVAIRNFMVNAQTGGTPEVDLKKAMEILQKEKKSLEAEKKKHLAERIERLQEIRMRMDYSKQELKDLYDEEKVCREKLSKLKSREKALENQFYMEPEEARYAGEAKGIFWKVCKIIMALLAVAAMGVALMATEWQIRAVACATILIACLGVSVVGKRDQKFKEEKREWELWHREQQMQEILQRQERLLREQEREAPVRQKLQMNLEWIQNNQREKEVLLQDLEEQCHKMQCEDDRGKELEEELAAIYLAMETMEEVTAEMYQEFSGKLNQKVSAIFSKITGGRYRSVFLDEEMQIRIHTPQRLLAIEQVSRGTMEQLYFALRMAAAELIHGKSSLPILLDDAFLTYDDTRLENTLRWLCECGHQVVLFTCQKREQELLEGIYEGRS